MVVQHNLRAMNSNRMLGLTTSVQSKSTEKLSSGYKINRAADDAAGLSISEKMRKQIRGLSQASLNAQDGISAVQTAEGALNEVQDMLQRMNELAVKASNGTMSENDRSYIQNEVDALLTEIDRVAETTKFNETYLLKGDDDGEKAVAYNYADKSDFLAKGKELYTQNDDGTFTKVAEGALLEDSKTYYSSVSSEMTMIGDKVDFSKGQVVGTQIDMTNDSGTYVETKDVISVSTLYTYNSTTKVYESVASNTVYDNNVDYFSMSTNASGEIKYAAIEDTNSANYTTAKEVVKAGEEVWDSDGNKLVGGDFVDTSKTHYSSIDATKDTTSYVTKIKVIDEDGLYLKDGSGNYTSVKKGDEYISSATYYSLAVPTAQGKVTNQAVVEAAPDTADGFKAAVAMHDSNGDVVSAGTTIDTNDEYYSAVTSSVTYTGTAVAESDLSNYKEDPGSFRFVDADGNAVAENGLYRFFDENKEYKDGTLFVKDENGELQEAAESLVNAYINVGEADKGALKLALHVGADATANNQIAINIEAMDAASLGIKGVKVDGADDTNARNTLDIVKEALQKVSTQRSALGAVQNRLEHTIANLDNVVENTTAAESQIRDTDMATEMVKYSNNNILAQAGQAMLAQANQANQGVLSLLG